MAMIFFECGVVVHSILVGVRLGSKRYDGTETTRTYVIALVFHQMIEAVALGIYISSKQIGFVKGDAEHWVGGVPVQLRSLLSSVH